MIRARGAVHLDASGNYSPHAGSLIGHCGDHQRGKSWRVALAFRGERARLLRRPMTGLRCCVGGNPRMITLCRKARALGRCRRGGGRREGIRNEETGISTIRARHNDENVCATRRKIPPPLSARAPFATVAESFFIIPTPPPSCSLPLFLPASSRGRQMLFTARTLRAVSDWNSPCSNQTPIFPASHER